MRDVSGCILGYLAGDYEFEDGEERITNEDVVRLLEHIAPMYKAFSETLNQYIDIAKTTTQEQAIEMIKARYAEEEK